jgi:multisubunit Na+/H+ antiporter MnhB subunit
VAGAGGVVLFLAILFFRDLLKSKLTEKLSARDAARTLNLLIAGVLGLAVIGGLTAFMSNQKPGCSTGNITITGGDSNSTAVNAGCGNQTR